MFWLSFRTNRSQEDSFFLSYFLLCLQAMSVYTALIVPRRRLRKTHTHAHAHTHARTHTHTHAHTRTHTHAHIVSAFFRKIIRNNTSIMYTKPSTIRDTTKSHRKRSLKFTISSQKFSQKFPKFS